jgi:Bacterial membrane protein YfhO
LRRREILILVVLALLPVVAHAPAWTEGRLLAPGDAGTMHFPMRAAVWEAYARHQWPAWNAAQFCGTPLLAAYRPGALYPPMAALAFFPPYVAFQLLILGSLSLAGILTYLYLRRLHAGRLGAYVAAVAFALGPYMVGHLDDTPAVVAAPLLPLLLLAVESHLERLSPRRLGLLAAAVALLLLAGSSEAAEVGAVLLAGRVLVAHGLGSPRRPPSPPWTVAAIVAGALLAAPQILPSLLAVSQAGAAATGVGSLVPSLPGAMGLAFRYISHTPTAALALAALPLLVSHVSVRVLSLGLALALVLQRGQPLTASGLGPLLFDFTLALLAGVSLGAQWRARRSRRGRRLRLYFLFFSLAAAAALSVSATFLGPLPQLLTGPVGILALSLILYFSLATSARPVVAGVWLIPLTASFLLQPQARRAWDGAPTRHELEQGSPTRAALDRLMGPRRGERILTLASEWPAAEVVDLGFDGLGLLAGRRSVNGYDPMVPLRTRTALGGMTASGLLPTNFYATDPALLDVLGARWIQAPSSILTEEGDAREPFQITMNPGKRRLFPLPILPVTEVRVRSSLAEGVELPDGTEVARLTVRLASGRGEFTFPLRAGVETAEWAYERADVRDRVRHARALVAQSWREPGQNFEGHRYLSTFVLPGRYNVDAVMIDRPPGAARLMLGSILLVDARQGRSREVSAVSAYLSDANRFREVASTPAVHLFERPGSLGRAWVVSVLRPLPAADVLARLPALGQYGIDPYREALVDPLDVGGTVPPAAERPESAVRQAEVVYAAPGRIELRAQGPGWLVVAEGWDQGWHATRDGGHANILRVNQMAMAVPLSAGTHRVTMRYRPPGLGVGLVLAALALLALLVPWRRLLG